MVVSLYGCRLSPPLIYFFFECSIIYIPGTNIFLNRVPVLLITQGYRPGRCIPNIMASISGVIFLRGYHPSFSGNSPCLVKRETDGNQKSTSSEPVIDKPFFVQSDSHIVHGAATYGYKMYSHLKKMNCEEIFTNKRKIPFA